MKKLVLIIGLLASTYTFAQGPNEVTINAGFASGAMALGGSYEHMVMDDIGAGGYALIQTKKEDAGVYQVTALGGDMKFHVSPKANFDVYVAPGFGIAMISDYIERDGTKDDKTVVGPSMKIGAQYNIGGKVKVGLERLMITNWFDDKVVPTFEYNTVTVGFDF
jgi:hypothetical protein